MLPGENEWKLIKQGEKFVVSADSKYKIKCSGIAEYRCLYIKK